MKLIKRLFFDVCYIATIILVVLTLLLTITNVVDIESIETFLMSDFGTNLRAMLSILVIAIWIYCMYVWSKHDKQINRFFLILFLSGFYILFYYRRILKNGWFI